MYDYDKPTLGFWLWMVFLAGLFGFGAVEALSRGADFGAVASQAFGFVLLGLFPAMIVAIAIEVGVKIANTLIWHRLRWRAVKVLSLPVVIAVAVVGAIAFAVLFALVFLLAGLITGAPW